MIRFLLIHLQVLFSFSLACARLSDRVDEREKRASSEVANEKKWREDRMGSLLAPPTTPATTWKTDSRFKVSNNWRSKSWNKLSQLTNHRVYQAGAGILESGIEKKCLHAPLLRLSTTPTQLFSLSFLDPLSSLSWSLEQATFSHILTFYIVWYALCGIEMA